MAEDYGAAQGIIDWAKSVISPLSSAKKPESKKKEDTSWHDSMVKEANEAFANEQKKLADRKPLGSAKNTKKKAPKKPLARKR